MSSTVLHFRASARRMPAPQPLQLLNFLRTNRAYHAEASEHGEMQLTNARAGDGSGREGMGGAGNRLSVIASCSCSAVQ